MGNAKEQKQHRYLKKNKTLPYINIHFIIIIFFNIHFKAMGIKICFIGLGIDKQTKRTERKHTILQHN